MKCHSPLPRHHYGRWVGESVGRCMPGHLVGRRGDEDGTAGFGFVPPFRGGYCDRFGRYVITEFIPKLLFHQVVQQPEDHQRPPHNRVSRVIASNSWFYNNLNEFMESRWGMILSASINVNNCCCWLSPSSSSSSPPIQCSCWSGCRCPLAC